MFSRPINVLLSLTLFFFLGVSDLFAVDPGQALVEVTLSPAGSFEIKGKVKGKVKKSGSKLSAKKLTFNTKKLTTGVELRDDHTRKKLKKNVVVTKAVGENGKGTATIKINGVKKKMKFTYKEEKGHVLVTFTLKLSDFKFEGISYLGVGVKDKVKVTAKVLM